MQRAKTARAIIETLYNGNRCIVTIKRTKYEHEKIKSEYYTLPGGHLENDETYDEALFREVEEELSIKVSIKEKLLHYFNEDLNRDEEFFLCDVSYGRIKEGNGPEWKNTDKYKYGSYEIVYIKVNEIEKYNILPLEVKNILIRRYEIQ